MANNDRVVGFSPPVANELLKMLDTRGQPPSRSTTPSAFGALMVVVTEEITAKVGDTLGKGKAQFRYISESGELTTFPDSLEEDVYNFSDQVCEVDTLTFVVREGLSEKLIWLQPGGGGGSKVYTFIISGVGPGAREWYAHIFPLDQNPPFSSVDNVVITDPADLYGVLPIGNPGYCAYYDGTYVILNAACPLPEAE